MVRLISALCGMALVGCCGSTRLYEVSDADNGGVPFFPLVPMHHEVRQYQQTWLRVDVAVTELVPLGTKDVTWKEEVYTSTLFAIEPGTFEQAAKDVGAKLNGAATPNQVAAILGELSKKYNRTEPDPFSTLAEIRAKGALVGVQHEVIQVPGNTARYMNLLTPHGGTANADIHLDARGTLTEAVAQKQDQLPQAVASGIATVGAAALTAVGTVAAAGIKVNPVVAPTPATAPPVRQLAHLVVTATRASRTYSVGMTWPAGKGEPPANPCLTIANFDAPQGACVLTLAVTPEQPPAVHAAPKSEK